MKVLRERIEKDGKYLGKGILKVDGFMNHQIDPILMKEIGEEFARRFAKVGATRILTAETSGIAPALAAAMAMKIPLVFARKHKPVTMGGEALRQTAPSHTHGGEVELIVSNEYLEKSDKVLIIDDFLSTARTINALVKLVADSGAELVGIGAVIEKSFQGGRDAIGKDNVLIESLAVIDSFEGDKITFNESRVSSV
jgi:xanthine phosphoribosyltransferase